MTFFIFIYDNIHRRSLIHRFNFLSLFILSLKKSYSVFLWAFFCIDGVIHHRDRKQVIVCSHGAIDHAALKAEPRHAFLIPHG
jgi:hypothetical protein